MKLLTKIVEERMETVLASRELRKLYKEQEETLERPLISIRLGIEFESMMDECPIEKEYESWDQVALKKQLETVEYYKEDLIECALIELEELQSSDGKY